MVRCFPGIRVRPRQPSVMVQTDFHSCPAVPPEFQAHVRFLPPGFRTGMRVSAGCGQEQSERTSFPELPFELLHFLFRQETPGTGPEFFILEPTDANSPEFLDGMTDELKHLADLLISPLM